MKKQEKITNYSVGDKAFCTAFIKENKTKFYLCHVLIEKIPDHPNGLYKIKILMIAESPIGGSPTIEQKSLLGRSITKKAIQMYQDVPYYMRPKNWLRKSGD